MSRPSRAVSAFRVASYVPLAALLGAAPATPAIDPLRFFEGRTLSEGKIKVVMKKPVVARSIGFGRLEPDGSLTLVQKVLHDGKPQPQRHWRVRRSCHHAYSASMNEAVGPVAIDRVGSSYRFRFRMKDHLSVEQWVTPLPGGKEALSRMKVKKLGLTVATSEGTIRRIG